MLAARRHASGVVIVLTLAAAGSFAWGYISPFYCRQTGTVRPPTCSQPSIGERLGALDAQGWEELAAILLFGACLAALLCLASVPRLEVISRLQRVAATVGVAAIFVGSVSVPIALLVAWHQALEPLSRAESDCRGRSEGGFYSCRDREEAESPIDEAWEEAWWGLAPGAVGLLVLTSPAMRSGPPRRGRRPPGGRAARRR